MTTVLNLKWIKYGKQTIDQEDIDSYCRSCTKSDWLTQGPAFDNFEMDLRNYFGAKDSAVSNGTHIFILREKPYLGKKMIL